MAVFWGFACKNPQFLPTAAARYYDRVVRWRLMKPNAKQNNEFAKWFQNWVAVTQQDRASVEPTRPEKAGREDGQEPCDSACLFTEGQVTCGRDVA
jgi:hypothetical protein